jgi:hypothetical protein
MVKRKTNLKVLDKPEGQFKGRLTNSPSRSAEKVVREEQARSSNSAAQSQVYNSQDQAIEALLSQVVSRLEDDPAEQADMKAFLSDLLEIDPVLRDEILSEVTIRSC